MRDKTIFQLVYLSSGVRRIVFLQKCGLGHSHAVVGFRKEKGHRAAVYFGAECVQLGELWLADICWHGNGSNSMLD